MLSQEHKEFLKTEIGRKWIIEKSLEVTPKDQNWQSFHTPYDLCEKMISKTNVSNKSILVLFNIEFLEVLIHKFGILSKNITFLADCRLESELASKTFHVNNKVVHNIKDIQEVLKNMGKTFDLCFSNPPYGVRSDYPDLLILKIVFHICNEIIFIHPAPWCLSNKPNDHTHVTSTRELIDGKIKELSFVDGAKTFGNSIKDPCVITHLDKEYIGHIYVDLFEKSYIANNISEVTIFGESWKSIVLPFKQKVENELIKLGNIYDWKDRINDRADLSLIDKNKLFCQFTAKRMWYSNKKFTFDIINDSVDFINFDEIKNKSLLVYSFASEPEMNNFIKYLKTNFVRFCYSIYKCKENNFGGSLNLIPVMDFTQEWTDEKIYEFFNIPKETIDYITNFFKE